jgi:hypothetical protein
LPITAPPRAGIRWLRSAPPSACCAKRAGADRPISVVHTDLPGNDFSALFETVAADPDSYLGGDANIFPYAIGRSFYESLFPPAASRSDGVPGRCNG